MLTAAQIKYIGEQLLQIPHIRRIRYATKGIAIFPIKILTDDAWVKALIDVSKLAVAMVNKLLFTHFSCEMKPKWSQLPWTDYGVTASSSEIGVLQDGVNNDVEKMVLLTRKLAYMNVQPYYVYQHDMVPGCEHFRTTLGERRRIRKSCSWNYGRI